MAGQACPWRMTLVNSEQKRRQSDVNSGGFEYANEEHLTLNDFAQMNRAAFSS